MSTQVSRHVLAMTAATLILTAGISRTAVAKQCSADSDCDSGYRCSLTNVGGGTGGSTGIANPGTVASPPTSVPSVDVPPPIAVDAGAATPVSTIGDGGVGKPLPVGEAGVAAPAVMTGTCQLTCTPSAANCPADFQCVPDVVAVSLPACPPNTKCETPPPQISDTGTCQPAAHACSTNADCAAPLVCQASGGMCSGGGSVGPDGVVTTTPETCTSGPSVCTYVAKTCAADTDCADSYQCVKVSEMSMCSGSAPACRPSDAGASCAPPEPPVCTTTTIMNCMPKQIACAAGQACPAGWSCFDFSSFSGTVPGWSADTSGKSCLPDGLILVAQGHAASSGTAFTGVGSAGDKGDAVPTTLGVDGGQAGRDNASAPNGSTFGPGSANPQPPSSAVAPAENSQSPDAGSTGAVAPMVHGGGCALGGHGSGTMDLWLALGLTGLVARLSRRRRTR